MVTRSAVTAGIVLHAHHKLPATGTEASETAESKKCYEQEPTTQVQAPSVSATAARDGGGCADERKPEGAKLGAKGKRTTTTGASVKSDDAKTVATVLTEAEAGDDDAPRDGEAPAAAAGPRSSAQKEKLLSLRSPSSHGASRHDSDAGAARGARRSAAPAGGRGRRDDDDDNDLSDEEDSMGGIMVGRDDEGEFVISQ